MNQTNDAIEVSAEALAWCSKYADFAFDLAWWFLVAAFLIALVETGISLWLKIRAATGSQPAAEPTKAKSLQAAGVDPVKLLEALKGLLEALKGLPAWIAIFLAGAALLWMATQKPEICASKSAAETEQTPKRNTDKAETNTSTPQGASRSGTNTQSGRADSK